MGKRDLCREFIERLTTLDYLDGDPAARGVDEALEAWISLYHPEGFTIDSKRRNLAIAMAKKKAEITELIQRSPFETYICAIIAREYKEIYTKFTQTNTKRRKIDEYTVLMQFALEVFSLGYTLKCLEDEEKRS